jgi:hypothetical protein
LRFSLQENTSDSIPVAVFAYSIKPDSVIEVDECS